MTARNRSSIVIAITAAAITLFVPAPAAGQPQDKLKLKSGRKTRCGKARCPQVDFNFNWWKQTASLDGTVRTLPGTTTTALPNGRVTALVPSHSYGDGANQLNWLDPVDFAALDPAFNRANASRGSRPGIEGRVVLPLNDFFSVWAAVHAVDTSLRFDEATLDQFERTRDGLEATVGELVSGGANRNVSATTDFDIPRSWRLGFSGGAQVDFPNHTFGGWGPFLYGGVSYVPGTGSPVTGRLLLDYSFASPVNGAPFHEMDDVTIRSSREGTFGVLAGGGLRRALTDRLSLQFGVQSTFQPNNLAVTVETNPTRVLSTPAAAVIFTPPAGLNQTIVMSNFAAVQSSLSVRQPEFETFRGSGMSTTWSVFVGLGVGF